MPSSTHHPTSRAARPHPDITRSFGLAGAMVANIALFMLLLVPMQRALLPLSSAADPPPFWVPTVEKKPEPPPPVDRIEPRKPRPDARKADMPSPPTPQPATPQATASTTQASVSVDDGVAPASGSDAGPVQPDLPPAQPMAGATLGLRSAPRPDYPLAALRAGIEGTVTLLVRVDAQGRPLDASVQQSSGNRQLDEAARRQVLKRWSFHPAIRDGQPIEASGLVAVAFTLAR